MPDLLEARIFAERGSFSCKWDSVKIMTMALFSRVEYLATEQDRVC